MRLLFAFDPLREAIILGSEADRQAGQAAGLTQAQGDRTWKVA